MTDPIQDLKRRVAALEAHCNECLRITKEGMRLPMTGQIREEIREAIIAVQPVGQAQPAPDAEGEAAVEAIGDILRQAIGTSRTKDDEAAAILAAIRAGKVPGVTTTENVERTNHEAIKTTGWALEQQMRADTMTEECQKAHRLYEKARDERDKLKADLAAMTERAETAEGAIRNEKRGKMLAMQANDPLIRERDAARADLAEAVGVLREARDHTAGCCDCINHAKGTLAGRIDAILAKHGAV